MCPKLRRVVAKSIGVDEIIRMRIRPLKDILFYNQTKLNKEGV